MLENIVSTDQGSDDPFAKYGGKEASKEEKEVVSNDPFAKYGGKEVKKKGDTQSGSQPSATNQVWGSKSQPKSVYDTLVTDQPKPTQALGTSNGKTKGKIIAYDQYRVNQVHNDLSSLQQATQQDNQDAQAEVKNDFADTGILNKAATFGKQAWNAIVDVNAQALSAVLHGNQVEQAPDILRFDTDRSKKYIDVAKQEYAAQVRQASQQKLVNKDIQIPSYNSDDIKKRAFEIAVKEKLGNKKQARINQYMETLPSDHKDNLKQLVVDSDSKEYQYATKKSENALQVSLMSKKEAESSQNKVNEYEGIFKSYKDKGQEIPSDIQQQFFEAAKYNEQTHKQALDDMNNHSDIVAKTSNISDNIDTFNRDYGFVSNTLRNLVSSTLSLGSGVLGGTDYAASLEKNIANRVGVHFLDPLLNKASEVAKYSSEKLKEGAKYVESGSEKAIGISNVYSVSGFGRVVANEIIAKNAPMLGLLATGPIGIGTTVLGSVGETFEGMKDQMASGEKNYSDLQLYGIPAAKGTVDAALFAFDGQMLKNTQRVIKNASIAERDVMAKASFDQFLKNTSTFKEVGKGIAKQQLHGLVVMNGVTIAKNVIDIVGGIDPHRNVTQGTLDASAASLVLVSAMHSAPELSAKIGYEITSNAEGIKISSKMLDLESQMNDHKLSQGTRDILKTQHDKLSDNLKVVLTKQARDIKSLSNDQYKEIVDINKTVVDLKNQAQQIKLDDTIKDENKTQSLEILADDFMKANKRKSKLLENGATAQFERMTVEDQEKYSKVAESKLNKQLNPDGITNDKASPAEIIKEAVATRNEEVLNNTPEPEVTTKGVEDVVSEPTELEVKPKTEEVSPVEDVVAPNTKSGLDLPKVKDDINNSPVTDRDGNNQDLKRFIPFSIVEEANKNDKRSGQTARQIAGRGGYSVLELDNLLPNWRELLKTETTQKEEVKPIKESDKVNTITKPIEPIESKEYSDFIDKGIVSNDRLNVANYEPTESQ